MIIKRGQAMTDIHDGKLNGLSSSFQKDFIDHRLVVLRLPLYLIRSISMRARYEEKTVQSWIKEALSEALDIAADEDWLQFDVDKSDFDDSGFES
jgi:hypothetical protein